MSDATFPSPEEFSDWRRENPNRGRAKDPLHCPLAECLRDRGAANPGVCSTWTDDVDRGHCLSWARTPGWAVGWCIAFDEGREISPLNPAKVDAPELVMA